MSLGEMGDASARQRLLAALEHEDPQVRWRAAMKLRSPWTAAEAQRLRQRLAAETDEQTLGYLRRHAGP